MHQITAGKLVCLQAEKSALASRARVEIVTLHQQEAYMWLTHGCCACFFLLIRVPAPLNRQLMFDLFQSALTVALTIHVDVAVAQRRHGKCSIGSQVETWCVQHDHASLVLLTCVCVPCVLLAGACCNKRTCAVGNIGSRMNSRGFQALPYFGQQF